MTIEEVGRKLAPKLRGWIGYFSRYNGYLMNQVWWRLNVRLIKWARRKFKTATFKGAYDKIRRICRNKPQLFHHWTKGFTV